MVETGQLTATVGVLARLRRIASFARPYRWRIGMGLTTVVVSAAISLALPWGVRVLLNDALGSGDRQLLHRLGLGLLALFCLRAVLSFTGTFLLRAAGERILADLRRRLYAHLQTLELGFYFDQRVGGLVSRLHSDTDEISDSVTGLIASGAIQVLKLIGAVAIMVALDLRMSAAVLLLAPVAVLLSRGFGRVLRGVAQETQARLAEASGVAQEAFSLIRVVQVFSRARFEGDRYDRAVEDLYDAARREVRANAVFTAVMGFLPVLSTLAVFWLGGVEVLAGRLEIGDLVAFLFYGQMVTQAIGSLAEEYGALARMAGASERVFELLDRRSRLTEAADAIAADGIVGRLELDHVGFGYPDGGPVLRDVSLVVEPGETVAVVGPSGSGKTTLLSLLPRLFDPTAGRITLDGEDLRAFEVEGLRRRIATVTQEVELFARTVRENIRYGRLGATDAEVEEAAKAANAHGFIEGLPLGYETEIGERGVKLSGGQRQRLSIARALLRDPKVLILDEATSAVDGASEAQIQEALKRLREGRTTFVAAHRLGTVIDADRIIVLSDGRVVAAGRHHELLEREPVYRALVHSELRLRELGKEEASSGKVAWA